MIKYLEMAKFSIVIPVGPGRKCEVKDSLKNLNYDKKYELIIEEGKNPSLNRNNGIKEAKGEIIVFLDDDAYVDKDLLKNAEKFLDENKDIDIVGGPQLTPEGDKFFAKISGIAIASYFGTQSMSNRYKKGKLNYDGWNLLTSANVFIRKKVFDKIGGFNEKLYPGEDPEFFWRAKKNNIKIAYNPDLVIYHKRRSNLFSFVKQFFLYGKVRSKTGKLELIFFTPSIFLIYLILLFFLSKIWLIPLILYIILALIFSVYDSIRNKSIITLPFLPFLYFLIHISYGMGFIIGVLVKFK